MPHHQSCPDATAGLHKEDCMLWTFSTRHPETVMGICTNAEDLPSGRQKRCALCKKDSLIVFLVTRNQSLRAPGQCRRWQPPLALTSWENCLTPVRYKARIDFSRQRNIVTAESCLERNHQIPKKQFVTCTCADGM